LNRIDEHIDLIKSLKQGDAKSLELLFRRLYPRLVSYANKYLNNTDEAEEIVQEVFFRIWKDREKLDDRKSINGYLFKAVKNNCFNLLQHWKVENKYADLINYVYQSLPEENNAYENFIAQELEIDFQKALHHLPVECRKIFELSRFEGLKYQEIAVKLNISIKTVETQMSRALQKMRLQLKEYLAIIILLSLFDSY